MTIERIHKLMEYVPPVMRWELHIKTPLVEGQPFYCSDMFELATELIQVNNGLEATMTMWGGQIEVDLNANDLFYWACSDGTRLEYWELLEVTLVYERLKSDGLTVWQCYKRGELPLPSYLSDEFLAAYEALPGVIAEADELWKTSEVRYWAIGVAEPEETA